MKKLKKFLSAEKISYLFFTLFLVSFVFPLRLFLYQKESFSTGLFSEFLTVFFEWSEIFLSLAFIFFAFAKKNIKVRKNFVFLTLSLLFLVGFSIFFAQSKTLAYFGFLKIIEAFFVAIFVFSSRYKIKNIALILLFVAFFQGLIGSFQFLLNGSIGLSFLGEQPMNVLSAGSPKIMLQGDSFLRATGTFLHPNILACFLLISFFLAEKLKNPYKILRWILIIPIVLTFSRAGILALLIGLLFKHKKALLLMISAISPALFFPQVWGIFRLHFDTERWKLMQISRDMILSHPFGVGSGNFILNMPQDSTWLYQPVHNIFLLMSAENGILAGIMLLFIFILSFLKSQEYRSLISTLFVFALFDHFLLTIHAGIIILAISLGIILRQKERRKLFKKFFV